MNFRGKRCCSGYLGRATGQKLLSRSVYKVTQIRLSSLVVMPSSRRPGFELGPVCVRFVIDKKWRSDKFMFCLIPELHFCFHSNTSLIWDRNWCRLRTSQYSNALSEIQNIWRKSTSIRFNCPTHYLVVSPRVTLSQDRQGDWLGHAVSRQRPTHLLTFCMSFLAVGEQWRCKFFFFLDARGEQ